MAISELTNQNKVTCALLRRACDVFDCQNMARANKEKKVVKTRAKKARLDGLKAENPAPKPKPQTRIRLPKPYLRVPQLPRNLPDPALPTTELLDDEDVPDPEEISPPPPPPPNPTPTPGELPKPEAILQKHLFNASQVSAWYVNSKKGYVFLSLKT